MDNNKIIRIVADNHEIKKVTNQKPSKNKNKAMTKKETQSIRDLRVPNFFSKKIKNPTFDTLFNDLLPGSGPARLIQLLMIPKLDSVIFDKYEESEAVVVQNNKQLKKVMEYYHQLAMEYAICGSEEQAAIALRKALNKMDEYADEYFFMIATYCFLLAKNGDLDGLEEVQKKFFEISMFPLYHICYIHALIINGQFECLHTVIDQLEKEMPELFMPIVNESFLDTLLDVMSRFMMIIENYPFSDGIKDVLLSLSILDELGLELDLFMCYVENYFRQFPPSKKLMQAALALDGNLLLNAEALEEKLPQDRITDLTNIMSSIEDDFFDQLKNLNESESEKLKLEIKKVNFDSLLSHERSRSGFIYDGLSKTALNALLENDFIEAVDFLDITEKQLLKIPGISKKTIDTLKKNGVIFKK